MPARWALPGSTPALGSSAPSSFRPSQSARYGRVDQGQAGRQRVGHFQDIARIELDVRIATGVHVTVGAIDAGRHFEHVMSRIWT